MSDPNMEGLRQRDVRWTIDNVLSAGKHRSVPGKTVRYNVLRYGTLGQCLNHLNDVGLLPAIVAVNPVTTLYEITIMPDTVERLIAYRELLEL